MFHSVMEAHLGASFCTDNYGKNREECRACPYFEEGMPVHVCMHNLIADLHERLGNMEKEKRKLTLGELTENMCADEEITVRAFADGGEHCGDMVIEPHGYFADKYKDCEVIGIGTRSRHGISMTQIDIQTEEEWHETD